jgi:hypothetical protein
MTSSSASSDWNPVDQHNICLPTIVSSTDLFDGELFGDELLDIYNSAVVDGQIHAGDVDAHGTNLGSDEGWGGVDSITETDYEESSSLTVDRSLFSNATDIPHLLDGHDGRGSDDHDPSHPGVRIAHVAAAIDDGLGAFRPSTSFNDLTTLLGPGGEPVATAAAVAMQGAAAQVSEPPSPSANPKPTKKRKSLSSGSSSEPSTSPKKRASIAGAGAGNARGGRKTSAKKLAHSTAPVLAPDASVPLAKLTVVTATAANTSVAPAASAPPKVKVAADSEDDTPNPLEMESVQANANAAAAASHGAPKVEVQGQANQAPAALPLLPVSPDNRDCMSDDEEPDEEFTKMAQAAVSNLIASAGKDGPPAASGAESDEKVDTTTDHIKALTGNNWVHACAGGVSVGGPPSPTMSDPKGSAAANNNNNRVRRQNLTADERARQNRDRNREHARNTRLRKKAYVEELKRTLIELVAQRDANEYEKRQAAQREMEQREVRFRVMEEFLKLRGRNEANASRWSAILEDSFTFTIPITPFRKMVITERGSSTEQVLEGVGESMADSALFSSLLQGLGSLDSSDAITFQYHVDRKNFFLDGCTGLLDWEGSTNGAVKKVRQFRVNA